MTGCEEWKVDMRTKKYTVDNWLKEEMKDEEFRSLWEARDEAYRVAQRLIHLRKEQGLSQTELARRAGLQQPAIARLESGAVKPSLDTIQKVAAALGKKVEVKFVAR